MSFFTALPRLLAGVTLTLAWHVDVHAQTRYPDKPIRLVVPFPAGSGTDIVGRLLAQEMSDAWNQPVIVDNRPGASTIVGTEIVAKSPPDGYTMVMASNNHAMNPFLFTQKLPFDPQKDFAAVAQVAILPFILVVNPQLPVKNLDELLALARRKPHEITYASTGNGTPPHVAGEVLKRAANVDLIHIPYKGSAAAAADVVSGQVSMMFINVACEAIGVTPYVPKPLTSGSKAKGRFGKQDFVYLADDDVYRCPAGEILTRHFTSVENAMNLYVYWTTKCAGCPLKSRCCSYQPG